MKSKIFKALIAFIFPIITYAQLSKEGLPPKDILYKFNSKYGNMENVHWEYNKKFLEYIGYLKKNNYIYIIRFKYDGKYLYTNKYFDIAINNKNINKKYT